MCVNFQIIERSQHLTWLILSITIILIYPIPDHARAFFLRSDPLGRHIIIAIIGHNGAPFVVERVMSCGE